jgi:hypothetical protein
MQLANRTQIFNDNPFSSTPQPFKMPESYAESIEQALHKLHACKNPNITVMAREFQAR